MSVRVGIVAHRARQSQVDVLVEALHPEVVSVDDGALGSGRNHVKVLTELALGPQVDWLVILEDDALPVLGFRRQAEDCLAVAPTDLVSFYLGTGYPAQCQREIMQAVAAGHCWVLHPYLRHGVAYAVQWGLVDRLIPAAWALVNERRWAADDAVSKWAMGVGVPVSYSNPSLVDHADGDSVIVHRTHLGGVTFGRALPRHAHNLGTRLAWDDSSATV